MTAPLRDRARGQWKGILPALGIAPQYLTGKHGPCPICREGKDRFRFDNRDGYGTWICTRCGSGDGAALVMAVQRLDFPSAAKLIEGQLGSVPVDAPARLQDPERVRAANNRLWSGSRPVTPGDPVGLYLARRVDLSVFPACLRYSARTRYQDGLEGEASWHPAMIARVVGADGRPVTLHRTYLTADGQKADVPRQKKLMAGLDCLKGRAAAVRLAPVGEELGVAEGIETALSAAALFGVPCWALISKGNLQQWEPPAEVRTLHIFGDADENFVGQAAAYALAERLHRGRKLDRITVRLPDREGEDWNDQWQRERGAA